MKSHSFSKDVWDLTEWSLLIGQKEWSHDFRVRVRGFHLEKDTTPWCHLGETTETNFQSNFSKKPVHGFPRRFRHFPRRFLHHFLSFLLSFDRGDQELSKTFYGLKIGPLLRKLQAFKDWSFLGGSPRRFLHRFLRRFYCHLIEEIKSFPKLFTDWKSDHY